MNAYSYRFSDPMAQPYIIMVSLTEGLITPVHLMADPHFDTATQRPATGMDEGARLLILRVLQESTGGDANAAIVAAGFFRDRYGGLNDYLGAVEAVWGHAERFLLERAISEAH